MSDQADGSPEDPRRIERVIEQRVRSQAPEWFPGLSAVPRPVVEPLSSRPRCQLYVVRLPGSHPAVAVLAKVRRGEPTTGDGHHRAPRPRLRSGSAPVSELTALEHEGLCRIRDAVGTGHPAFGAVRPLDLLTDESALVMDYVTQPTLREGFMAESRPAGARRASRSRRPAPAAWRNAGAWLRVFHDLPPDPSKPARQSDRDEVVERFHAYGTYLASRLGNRLGNRLGSRPGNWPGGGRSVVDLADAGARLAGSVLPRWLDLCVGHGDYVARNMFADPGGRITVFDPMPRWRVPRLEDVCRFVVGMRLSGLQVHSLGTAYGHQSLAWREGQFLAGYFGAEQVPWAQVRCYQLLILLDKWSALVDSADAGGGWRATARRAVGRPVNAYVAREARRLVELQGPAQCGSATSGRRER